ncbi:MAG: type IV toxin-antitoxin system AbiEi family antitoxin domain-containing protein [Candidatus Helarchaeota archaeon]
MRKKSLIYPIAKGIYSTTEDLFIISSNLIDNSYISFTTGLYIHGIIDQIPSTIQLVVPKKRKFKIDWLEQIQFNPQHIFGFERQHNVAFGELEKIVTDILYKPKHSSLYYALDGLKQCNPDKVVKYAKRMNLATIKRVCYLLKLLGHEVKEIRLTGVHKLNPSKKEKGTFNKRWGLYVNEVFK